MEIKTILNSLVDLFFPMRCIHCNEVILSSQVLCASCLGNLAYTHWNLDQNNKAFTRLEQYGRIEAAYSLLHFTKKNSTQSILHEIKYKNRPELGALLARKIRLNLDHIDIIIPIPLHPKRLQSRGYNQVEAFAQQLAQVYGIEFRNKALSRVKYNSSQVFKGKSNRIKDLQNAFQLNDHTLKGHVLLIDDLITTGATLSQAVQIFNTLDEVKVSVLTIACA